MLLPKFEEALDGKIAGDPFEFTLSPEEGYGTYNPKYLIELPLEAFAIDGKTATELLVVGRVLPMLNSEGQVVQGTVAAVGEKSVTMDFNHPMAGKTLHFTGKVETVRDATDMSSRKGSTENTFPRSATATRARAKAAAIKETVKEKAAATKAKARAAIAAKAAIAVKNK